MGEAGAGARLSWGLTEREDKAPSSPSLPVSQVGVQVRSTGAEGELRTPIPLDGERKTRATALPPRHVTRRLEAIFVDQPKLPPLPRYDAKTVNATEHLRAYRARLTPEQLTEFDRRMREVTSRGKSEPKVTVLLRAALGPEPNSSGVVGRRQGVAARWLRELVVIPLAVAAEARSLP